MTFSRITGIISLSKHTLEMKMSVLKNVRLDGAVTEITVVDGIL